MIGLFVWGAMYLARTIECAVQARWSLTVPSVGLLSLAGLGADESGINSGVIGVVAIALAFVSIAPELAGVVLGLSGACLAGCVFATSQPAVLTRAKAGHECRKGCHRLRLFLAEVSGEPFIMDAMFKGREGFGIQTVDDLILFN